jgi:alpha-D-ribose 1-methylphosphonate 5-triphosphate synthase subunit PhnG
MLDNSGKDPASRQAIIGALAAARPDDLAKQWQSWPSQPDFEVVRGPETGLVMVRGRAGGGGSPFNVGEVTVTRATVRLDTGEVGHAYALGRDGDALWQRPADRAAVEQLVAQLQARADAADDQRRQETAATRVNFFTMVRGDD